jgi:hypothetical protein
MADTTITATQVIADFGAYYINQGQNMESLLIRPFEPFGTREAFTNVPTNDTVLRYSDVQVGEILQPYQDGYTPKGSSVFLPVTIDMKQVKVDQQFNPNKLVNTWLGFLTNNKTDRKTWPFVRWFIEVYLLNKLFEDLEKEAVYKGVYAAPVVGTPGAANTVIDGIKKIINDAITATTITPINTGAPSADPVTWCEQVEAFIKGIPELYWDKNIMFNMNRTLRIRFIEGKKKKYNMYYAQESDLETIANFPNFKVKGRASMNGSSKIWGTPLENAVFAAKGFENANAFELESVDRSVKIWTDFHIGMGFLLKDLVFTNDQDL